MLLMLFLRTCLKWKQEYNLPWNIKRQNLHTSKAKGRKKKFCKSPLNQTFAESQNNFKKIFDADKKAELPIYISYQNP